MESLLKKGNRFGGLDGEGSDTVSDFSFGKGQWSAKRVEDVFQRLHKEKDPARVRKIVEKGLYKVVYEEPKADTVLLYAEKALKTVNYEKGILDALRRLRVLEESGKGKGVLKVVMEKIKELGEERKEKMTQKKRKIVEEREEELVAFLGYFLFKFHELTKEEYFDIFKSLECHHVKHFDGQKNSNQKQKMMRQVYLCIFNIIKKSPDCLKECYSDLVSRLIANVEEFLQKPSINSMSFLKYAESITRLLSLILENIKGKNIFTNEIIVRGFVALTKYLFLGTIFQEKIMKSLTVKQQESSQTTSQVFELKEENKEDEALSDNDSNIGSTYTDSVSQDVLMRGKTGACNTLKFLFKFGNKLLFDYRHCVVPSFVIEPIKDFIKFYKGIFNEEWNEFYKCADKQIFKEPSFLYLFLTETDTNFKLSLVQSISSFIMHSPIEKWQGPLERDEITCQYHGFKYELIDSKSSSKILKPGGFIPLSQLIAHFVRYLHYCLIYLINKDNTDEIKSSLLKLLSIIIQVTPYKKMNDDLLKCCMIPHISNMLTSIITDDSSEINQSIQKNLLLCFSAGSSLLCPIMLNIDSKSSFEVCLNEEDDNVNIIKWLLTDLHENSVKKSFEAIDTLTSIAKNYSFVFIDYWSHFKDFINIVFSINETRKTVAVLKLIETWINSLSSQCNSIAFAAQSLDDDERREEVKKSEEEEKSIKEKLQRYDILKLEGCPALLNKYLSFFIKADDTDTKVTVVNILNILSQKQWETIFALKERQKIIDTVLKSKIPKSECSNFIGHIFLIKLFFDDPEYISKLIDKLYQFKSEKSLQTILRNCWSLGNLCENCNFDVFSESDQAKICDLCVQYSSPEHKDKPVAHSVRAVGQIFANCKDFSCIKNLKVVDWKEFFMIIVNNILHKSPKVSWNSCVLLRTIMENEYMRGNVEDLLFSKTTIQSLCSIIKENSNFKTRIHAVQTLNTFRTYHDFGESNLDVWEAFLVGLQNVNETTDFTEVKYISTLEYQLVCLFVKLIQMVDESYSLNERFTTFINEKARDIERSIVIYLQKQFKVTAFSAVYAQEIDINEVFIENKVLKDTITNLQIGFKTMLKLIEHHQEISIPFSVFDTISSIANIEIDKFASLEILKVQKAAFDKDKF